MLTGQVGSQNLLQVAIPGLEDRARTFAPLHGVLLMPGGTHVQCVMDEQKSNQMSE